MDPILVFIAASTLVTAAIGILAVIRTNRLRTQLEDRILMLEMDLATVRRDTIEAPATEATPEIVTRDSAAIDAFAYEPRSVEALAAYVDVESEPISIVQPSPSTALAVVEPVATKPIAEIVSVGNAFAATPSPLLPLPSRTWEPPEVTRIAVQSRLLDEQMAMNSLAKVGVALLVLGVASLPWRQSNRLNPTR